MVRGSKTITVVVIEDSALMRRELAAIIDSDPEMKVVATAADGEDGLRKVRELQPDVVTIDINMPGMDGLTCLQYIMIEMPRPCVIISAHTGRDSLETFEALELGAVDFIRKPSGEISRDIGVQARNIIRCVKGAAQVNLSAVAVPQTAPIPGKEEKVPVADGVPDMAVIIGVSTGGPRSLMQLVSTLPADLGAPVVIVQHMPEHFTASFAERLNNHCRLNVSEARQGEKLVNNEVYVAPGGYHLTLQKQRGRPVIRLARVRAEDLVAPSVNKALHTAVDMFGSRVVGVILTGMGNDGSEAMERLHRLGGWTIAESEKTAVIFGMPKEVIERNAARIVAPLESISKEIVAAVRKMKASEPGAHPAMKGV